MMYSEVCLRGTNQRKLKRNSSFDGVKTKADVSWVCDVCGCASWVSACCRFFSVAAFWVSALRWKTHFFGESDTSLTLADAISVGIGEICHLTGLWPHLYAQIALLLQYTHQSEWVCTACSSLLPFFSCNLPSWLSSPASSWPEELWSFVESSGRGRPLPLQGHDIHVL